MPTEFGAQVLASVNKPADPLTIDGLPAREFAAQERAAAAQGGTLQYNDDGTPYDPSNEGKGLFTQPNEEKLLFPQKQLEQISNNFVWNKGHEDAVLNGALSSTTARADA